jgi:hypothetical protein
MQTRIGKVTIIEDAALSTPINIGELGLCGLIMPAEWTAAVITLAAAAEDGGTFLPVYDKGGNEVSFTVAADRFINLNPAEFSGLKYFKLRSGTVGAPVNQDADREVLIISRKLV